MLLLLLLMMMTMMSLLLCCRCCLEMKRDQYGSIDVVPSGMYLKSCQPKMEGRNTLQSESSLIDDDD